MGCGTGGHPTLIIGGQLRIVELGVGAERCLRLVPGTPSYALREVIQPQLRPTLVATLDRARARRHPAESVVGSRKTAGDVVALSEREGAVLRLIAQGYSNKEIAAQLDLSVKTVETYKARAMEKLNLASRVDIVRYASERGWLGKAEL